MMTVYVYTALAVTMLCLAVKDIRERRVPNTAIVLLVVLWLVWRAFLTVFDPQTLFVTIAQVGCAIVVLGGLLVATSVAERLRRQPLIGGGDIKLITVLVLYLGLEGLAICMMIACLIGLVFAIAVRVRSNPLRYGIPFAACLSCGMFMTFLVL